MSGETNAAKLLTSMSPRERAGIFVFVTVDSWPVDIEVFVGVIEAEGLILVIARQDADRLGFQYNFPAGWITLQRHFALAAGGLTAAVSAAPTDAGISYNVRPATTTTTCWYRSSSALSRPRRGPGRAAAAALFRPVG